MNTHQVEKFGYKQELRRSLGLWQLTAFGGALLGFALLNLSVVWFYFSNKNKLLSNKNYFRYVIAPLFGLVIVMWVFYGLNEDTHILGTIWLFIGIIYLIIQHRKLPIIASKNML